LYLSREKPFPREQVRALIQPASRRSSETVVLQVSEAGDWYAEGTCGDLSSDSGQGVLVNNIIEQNHRAVKL
jgi:hypothetical protein